MNDDLDLVYSANVFTPQGVLTKQLSFFEFNNAKIAKEAVGEALGIEEKMNMLLENYAEFERDLLGLALDDALKFRRGFTDASSAIHRMNRRIANLLSICSLYRDQVRHALMKLFGESHPVRISVVGAMKHEYDLRPGYRFCEALRNYVQHRGLPVHTISFKSKWLNSEELDAARRRQSVSITCDSERLKEDKKFKRQALKPYEDGDRSICLQRALREYVTGLFNIHKQLRSEMSQQLEDWDENYIRLLLAAREEWSRPIEALYMIARTSDGDEVVNFTIFEDLIDRRKELKRLMMTLGDLTTLEISSYSGDE